MTSVINLNHLTEEERSLAVFVQGLLNKKEKRIFLDFENYLEYLHDAYKVQTIEQVISKYKEEIEGLIIYDFKSDDISINMASTISAANPWLGVPRSLAHWDIFKDMVIKVDLEHIKGTPVERQKCIFDTYKNKLNPDGLIHQVVEKDNFHWQLRDYGIAYGWFTFYTDESDEGIGFRKEVLEWLNNNTAIFGWCIDELAFVKDISNYGCYIIPMDWSINHSYMHRELQHPIEQRCKDEDIFVEDDKHYLAIVVSDGDNIQWLERNFSTTSNFGQRIEKRKPFKMTWTIAPMLSQLSPDVLEYIYDHADKDYFISGVSGMGYMNALEYPIEHLDTFTMNSSKLFRKADINVTCMLDSLENTTNIKELTKRIDYYARYDNIKGAIWEIDPNRYESGKGRVFWSSNGKPFVSVRLSLWHPSNDPLQVDDNWIIDYANKINESAINPYIIDGYTVLNVHPWTTNMEQLNLLVSKLKKHVKIISAGELIDLVEKNVAKVNSIPSIN